MSSQREKEIGALFTKTKASLQAMEKQISGEIRQLSSALIKQNAELQATMFAKLRESIGRQNADNADLTHKQNAAIVAALQEQTRAIERQTRVIAELAEPGRPRRECRKRNRAEGTSADAGRVLGETDDAVEGTSTARGKKMKATAPAMEDLSVNTTSSTEGTCTWTIPNFSKLKVGWWGRKFSGTFSIGGHEWKLRLYPKGDTYKKDKSASLYLHLAADPDKLPQGWELAADCSFSVICQHDPSKSHTKKDSMNTEFRSKYMNWGYANLISLEDLRDPKRGYLVNDTAIIQAKIKVSKPVGEQTSSKDTVKDE